MANKRGRPGKYESHVEPYLDEIKDMALVMTEEQIAETLGIGYTSFRKYKSEYPALMDSLKNGRKQLVFQLKSTLIERAKGFHYKESKVIKEDGVITKEEIYTKFALPDVAANNLLLKNYDPDNWANDPQALKLKREELEIKKKQLEDNDW